MPRLVVAPDKFRGSADARDVAAAMSGAARTRGWDVTSVAMSDGGEGLLDACAAVCPEVVVSRVAGPDGRPIDAEWRVGRGRAVVESARASGLAAAGGPDGNDPLAATSFGTGQLVVAAAERVGPGGTVIVGLGGSATTDGGLGALEAIGQSALLSGIRLVAACDVRAPFVDAARLFAPQKGADPGQVAELAARLEELATRYATRYGVDVRNLAGAGSAGGLGGAIAVLGGELRSGYGLVRALVGLPETLEGADRVVTGEGALDVTSFGGKVVGGIVEDARIRDLTTLVLVGRCTDEGEALALDAGCAVVSLTREFGADQALRATVACVASATGTWLDASDRSG
jgi:glycerate kinase